MTRYATAGFTLIEVLLVVTLIGILSAIAIPIVARSRAVALEASTIGSLRALHSAQTTFATSCAGGFYSPSVAVLRQRTGAAPFIGPEFTANTVDRHGYRIRFTAGSRAALAPRTCNGLARNRAVQDFFVAADPLAVPNQIVARHFGVNAKGVIFQSERRIRPVYNADPPAPAVPIR